MSYLILHEEVGMFEQEVPSTKHRSTDRVLVLKTTPGKFSTSDAGLIDNRLFTGENKVRAIMDPTSCLWSLKYDKGFPPASLRQRKYTSFSELFKHVEKSFKRRNIDIVEVID